MSKNYAALSRGVVVAGDEMPVQIVKTVQELRARPCLDTGSSVSVEQVVSIIAHYSHLDDDVICQVATLSGRCGHRHRKGWIAVLQSGKEGLIGGHCCNNKFRGHVRFGDALAGARRQVRLQEARDRLAAAIDTHGAVIDGLAEKSRSTFQRLGELMADLGALALPPFVDMAKTGRSAVIVEILKVEPQEDGSKIKIWTPQRIGAVAGLGVFEPDLERNLRAKIFSLRNALKGIRSSAPQKAIEMERAAQSLDEAAEVSRRLLGLEREITQFLLAENLQLAFFVLSRDDLQERLAELILKMDRTSEAQRHSGGKSLARTLRDSLRKRMGGDFRTPR